MPRLKHLGRAERLGCCQIDLLAPGMLSNGFLAEWLDSGRRGWGRGVGGGGQVSSTGLFCFATRWGAVRNTAVNACVKFVKVGQVSGVKPAGRRKTNSVVNSAAYLSPPPACRLRLRSNTYRTCLIRNLCCHRIHFKWCWRSDITGGILLKLEWRVCSFTAVEYAAFKPVGLCLRRLND